MLPACSLERVGPLSQAGPLDSTSHAAVCLRCSTTASFYNLQSILCERGVELLANCTADCWLFENLDVLNEILCNVVMSLEKRRPDALSLLTLASLRSSDMVVDVNRGLVLLLVLLQLHGCIEELHIELGHGVGTDILTILPAGLSKNRGLKLINLRSLNSLPEGLGRCKSVSCLVLDNVSISVHDAEEWSLFMESCSTLMKLELNLNQLDELSSCTVLTNLNRASHLTELCVRNNRLGVKSLEALSRVVVSSSVLASLTLWNCALTNEHLEPLSQVLTEDCAVIKLDLSCNFGIGDKGIKCLSECLCKNLTLEELCLVSVGLSGVGCASLGGLLAVNSNLTCLNMSENCIGDGGAASLAVGLRRNFTLKTLIVASISVGANGVTTFADVVLARSGMLTIKLGKVKIAGAESRSLAQKLGNTRVREHLEVFWDTSSVADLASVLSRCTHMDELTVPDIGRGTEADLSCFSTLFKGLIATDNVRMLTITNVNSIGDGKAFSTYLSTTRRMEKLRFVYGSLSRLNDCFMASLAKNVSLKEVHFGDAVVASSSALAEVLLRNSTLEAVKFYNFQVEDLGMDQLIRCLKYNSHIVRFETGPACIPPRSYFRLHELLKRNWDLLVHAVAFVVNGARDRASAGAFEGKRHSVELLAQVASLVTVSKLEAEKMVRGAELRRRREFFSLAGVVRRNLHCFPALSNKPQLDSLAEVLCEIASYLSMSDVRSDLVPLDWTIPVKRRRR